MFPIPMEPYLASETLKSVPPVVGVYILVCIATLALWQMRVSPYTALALAHFIVSSCCCTPRAFFEVLNSVIPPSSR